MMKKMQTLTMILLACSFWACGGGNEGGEDDPGKITAPEAPSAVALHSSSETSLTFQWSLVSGATSYDWTLSQGGSTVQEGSVTARNVAISGLTAGTTYSFSVRSVAGDQTSAWTTPVEATTDEAKVDPDPEVPEQPDPGSVSYEEFLIPSAEEDGVARAFPGAEGGGMYTTGGRGGDVYHVTNLNDSGEGSLRWAVEQTGARTIVFDVAGTIALQSTLRIRRDDVTIAGQTAPGDGICIKDHSVRVDADNVIIRFIRFRMGDETQSEDDAIWGRYLNNVILDHCSMSWSTDECASFYGNVNFTMQWCIVAESLKNSVHGKGSHGYGGIWGGKDASFHHNLLADHDSRNPRIDHPGIYDNNLETNRGNVDLRNNAIYNWGSNSSYGGEDGHFNYVGNYFKPGPASTTRNYFVDAYWYNSSSKVGSAYPELYLEGNYHSTASAINSNDESSVYWHDQKSYSSDGTNPEHVILGSPLKIYGKDNAKAYTTTHSAADAFNAVCSYAGASLSRDAVDTRVTGDAKDGKATITDGGNGSKNGLIDSQSAVGGWPNLTATDEELGKAIDSDGDGIPDWYEELFGLDKSNAADGKTMTLDKNGRYTNLEMYLHYLVKDIVAAQVQGGQYTEL